VGSSPKHIADAGWSEFFTQLEYKANWQNRCVLRVDPKYTSQICSNCNKVDKLSRLSQSKYVCTSCGYESNADVNASKNILARAIANTRQREPLGCA